MDLRTDLLALLCPDWRPPSLVYDATLQLVAYANWPCLEMFDRGEPVKLSAGELSFATAAMTHHFAVCVRTVLDEGSESSRLVARSGSSLVSILVHNPMGLIRETLSRRMESSIPLRDIVVVEFVFSDLVSSTVWMDTINDDVNTTFIDGDAEKLLRTDARKRALLN